MPTALFVSPHLDDAVFSCGGLMASLSDQGWHTVLATVFTRSVVPAHGFALACQLDKELPADADYMALRRAEDCCAAAILGVTALHWLDLPEAPHRGYGSAPELFADLHADDDIARDVARGLSALADRLTPDLVVAPQGLGRHVDHQATVRAVLDTFAISRTAFYRDTPYALRQPEAQRLPCVPPGDPSTVPIAAALDRKVAASCAYATQIGFQFGGPTTLGDALRAFAAAEGDGPPAERFCGCSVP